ncbi:hypothetical protein [Blattabacterium cuenoti]|uniref:hypothetical protein n=1 Tax=Blattabacterium cuenoti TaxID=1653831 RepID=UPI00374D10E5
MRVSFSLNKYILGKKIDQKNYYIIFIYDDFYLPNFQDINQSIIKIFYKIKKYYEYYD